MFINPLNALVMQFDGAIAAYLDRKMVEAPLIGPTLRSCTRS